MNDKLDEVRKLVASGRTIDAIKLYREATGLGLKEAKDAIDRCADGGSLEAGENPAALRTALDPSAPADAEIKRLLETGRKFEAVKLLRARSELDLAAAKDIIDRMQDDLKRRRGAGQGSIVDRGDNRPLLWLVLGVVIVAGAVAYLLLRGIF